MISIKPGETRFVDIHHCDWDLHWALQFPEGIHSRMGVTMTWMPIRPDWTRTSDQSWGYEWRTTSEYIEEVRSRNDMQDPAGNPIVMNFVIGLALRAKIEAAGYEIRLSLTLTNESPETFEGVECDGGCLQARSKPFMDGDEVARSRILVDGAMAGMANLPRTIPERCSYQCDAGEYEEDIARQFEWFWGRSTARIDAPVIVGAVSRDKTQAVVLGYEGARSGLQNADGHHCMHSRPCFGKLTPGDSVTRRGHILFGDDINTLASELKSRVISPSPFPLPPAGERISAEGGSASGGKVRGWPFSYQ